MDDPVYTLPIWQNEHHSSILYPFDLLKNVNVESEYKYKFTNIFFAKTLKRLIPKAIATLLEFCTIQSIYIYIYIYIYIDANWAGDQHNFHSTTKFLFQSVRAISLLSKKQSSAELPISKAEYVALID